jgi:hypothetical protein
VPKPPAPPRAAPRVPPMPGPGSQQTSDGLGTLPIMMVIVIGVIAVAVLGARS